VKKVCGPEEDHCKKCGIQVGHKEMAVMVAKFLITAIQVNLMPTLVEKATQIHMNCHY